MAKNKKNKCNTCQYRQPIGAYMYCNYISVTGHMRGCSAADCTKYVKGRKLPSMDEEELRRFKEV